MSTTLPNAAADNAQAQNPSEPPESVNSPPIQHHASVDNNGDNATFLPKDQGLNVVAIGNLLEDSDDGSVSLFLDSANSSVNLRQNESCGDNDGVASEQTRPMTPESTSLLYRDITIPHYKIPAPYHWEHPTGTNKARGSDSGDSWDHEDDEEQQQQASGIQSQQGRNDEVEPFMKAKPIASSMSVSSTTRHPSNKEEDNRRANIRRLFIARRVRFESQSLVADSPMEFGKYRHSFKDYGGRATTVEQFQDEPYSLEQGRARVGLEALPDDEYDPKSEVQPYSSGSKKRVLLGRRIGLVLCMVGLVIVISTVLTIFPIMLKGRYHIQEAESTLTLQPTPAPSRKPTSNTPITHTIPAPTITFPPSGQSDITVPVLNDGYVDLGALRLQDFQVQRSTTLLVQDGKALSIIEFDTVATLGPFSTFLPWLANATIQLTVANLANVDDNAPIRLYANLYPNTITMQPYEDVGKYRSGQIDFQIDWIPIEIIPNQTEIVDIDVTPFLSQRQWKHSRALTQNDNTNIKVMLAHDQSEGKEVSIRFCSSESATPSQRPQLTLVFQAPDFTRNPAAPTIPPIQTIGPTIALSSASTSQPSTTPTTSPSLQPSVFMDPSYNPTMSPEPTVLLYPSCSICGELIFVNAGAVINVTGIDNETLGILSPQEEETTCGILQESGLNGYLSPEQCQQVQSQVDETCCSPIDKQTFICNLCGGNITTGSSPGSVVNLDALVSIPVLGEVETCRYYDERAKAGMISSSQCSTIQRYTAPICCGIVL